MSDLLLTAAQMRALEAAAIESGAVTGLELMERAGRGAVEAILEEWPELAASPGRAVVLCGPGNNGGDGFVVARLLAEKGWEVEVFLYGDPEKLPPDARVNYERWGEMGEVEPFPPKGGHSHWDRAYCGNQGIGLLVDAIFGTGLARELEIDLLEVLKAFWTITSLRRSVAIDVISGIDADSGKPVVCDPDEFNSLVDLTVTFQVPKLGHYLGEEVWSHGALRVVDIGLAPALNSVVDDLETVECISSAFLEGKRPWLHKYDHGHALVLTGGMGRTGAARLAARGALRVGAGLVTLGAPGSAMLECAAQITALMLRRCEDGGALAEMLADERLNALCLGPGLGTDARAEGLVAAAVSSGRLTVLDADALTILAGQDAVKLHERCVLTPHGGEFARLFPDLAEQLDAPATKGPAYSKVDAAREAAARVGAVVLFKGPDTVIAAPDGRAAVNAAVYDRAAPWLATAGSGDVLAGMIAGLLARGLAPFEAACSAAWLHVEAARAFGPGLIAEDLPEMLPKVFAVLDAPSS